MKKLSTTVLNINKNQFLKNNSKSLTELFALFETKCNQNAQRVKYLREIKLYDQIINLILLKYLNLSDTELANYKVQYPGDPIPIEYYQYYSAKLTESINIVNSIDKAIAKEIILQNNVSENLFADNFKLIQSNHNISSQTLKDVYFDINKQITKQTSIKTNC